MTWNLFLDDERQTTYVDPNGERMWFVARSTEEAKDLVIDLGFPWFMSLDHDLGPDDTTMKFLNWLVWEYGGNAITHVPDYQIHSANPIGSRNIESFMESWKRTATGNDIRIRSKNR